MSKERVSESVDRMLQIDVEIEACEHAIGEAFARVDVADLKLRIEELIKERKELR